MYKTCTVENLVLFEIPLGIEFTGKTVTGVKVIECSNQTRISCSERNILLAIKSWKYLIISCLKIELDTKL